ncbi:hypothetical protein PLESTM_000559100 [Pleodorina starrii]|nr:hypothetical protein PLESTM_000559100 [Pleodorina starrii]
MASKFKAKQQAKREALCQKLVATFLPGLQASDPANFKLAYNFVAQNLAEPALDANPRDAEDWLSSLAYRCEVDSQGGKAACLRALLTEIKRLGLKGDYPEPEARILHLLIGLASRPLDSSLEHAASVVRQVREKRLAEAAAAAAKKAQEEAELLAMIHAEASSGDEEDEEGGRGRGGYASSSSSLSDWSEDERAGGGRSRAQGGVAAGAAAVGRGGPAGSGRPGGGVALSLAAGAQVASPGRAPSVASPRDAAGQLQMQMQPPPTLQPQLTLQPQSTMLQLQSAMLQPMSTMLQPQSTALQPPLRSPVPPDPPPSAGHQRLPPRRLLAAPGSLRSRVVAAAGLPLRVAGEVTPLPRVLLALLAALQGRSSEEISWDTAKSSFVPSDELFLASDVSFSAVRAAVRPLIRAATGIRRLDDWVRTCLHRQRNTSTTTTFTITNTTGAAAAAAAGSGGRRQPQAPPAAGAAGGPAAPGAATPLPSLASAAAASSSSPASVLAEGCGLLVPAWLLEAAGVKGGARGSSLRLVQGPTLQALHQAMSSCLHSLRTPLVELEQRVTTAAAAAASAAAATATARGEGASGPIPSLPSLYELLLACQPFMRRAAGLVAAYLEVAKPLVAQLAAAAAAAAAAASATPAAAAAAAAAATASGDFGVTPRPRYPAAPAVGVTTTAAAAAAVGASAAVAGGGGGGGGGRSVALQLQAGLVLERLHAMTERSWLDGVFRPLESHTHRCMLLYLYLSALEPLLDGLAEWLWTSGGAAGAAAAAAAAAGGGVGGAGGGPGALAGGGGGGGGGGGSSSELPSDFFIVRGGGPGREVPPDHPAFWREGYVALTRPPHNPTAAAAATVAVTATTTATAPGSVAPAAAAAAGGVSSRVSYMCPPFLEPLVPIIMAAGKSLRLRQREADSMEAAATTTAGAAGPGYGSAGSAVLDPVALEESYALYGLCPDTEVGMPYGSGRDLKRCLMERLMSYLSPPGFGSGSGNGAGSGPGVGFGTGVGAGPGGLGPAGPTWPAAPEGPGGGALLTWAFSAAPESARMGLGAGGAVFTWPQPAQPPQPHSPGRGFDFAAAVAAGGVAAAGGLWFRMATASARLWALCQGSEQQQQQLGQQEQQDDDDQDKTDEGYSGGLGAVDGRWNAAADGGGGRGGRGPAAGSRRLGALAAPGSSSPVTPLDCGGVTSGGSSPSLEGEDAAAAAAASRRRRRQQQQQQIVAAAGLQEQEGKEGQEEEEEGLGGWWPRRCEQLLLRSSSSVAAAGWAASLGGGGGGGDWRPPQAGPWHRIHQQLRGGPRATALAATKRGAGAGGGFGAGGGSLRALGGPGPGPGPGGACNAYQHPALDLLLLHACGRQPQQPLSARSAGGGGGSAAAAGGGAGGGGGGVGCCPPLGLPHPQELLRLGLVEPLQDRAYHVNDALLLKLLSGWGLEARLAALPSVFLLSSPAVRSWADRLVSALLSGMRLGEPPLEEHQIESMLQEALSSASPDDLLPPPTSLVLHLAPPPATGGTQLGAQEPPAAGAAAAGGAAAAASRAAAARASAASAAGLTAQQQQQQQQQEQPAAKFQAVQELDRSVAELERLQLGLAPSWVVALVADGRVLRAYSQALVFMLQLRWVRAALDAAHKSFCLAWRERQMREHPNSWRPLRRPGAPPPPPPLRRSMSAGVADAAAAAAAGGPARGAADPHPHRSSFSGGAAAAAGGVRGSSSSNSLLGGPAAAAAAAGAAARNAPGGGGSAAAAAPAAGAGAGAGAAVGGASASSPAAATARLQSSLAAMVHFMATLEQWVAAQLVHEAWEQLMQGLASSRNLDDVCEAHTAYTVTLLRRCFRYSGEEGSRHMGAALRKCLDACLRFAAAVSSLTAGSGGGGGGGGAAKVLPVAQPPGGPPAAVAAGPAAAAAAAGAAPGGGGGGGGPSSLPDPLAARLQEEADRSATNFSYWLGYLVRFVSTRALLSPSSDLGDLLMRLNFNNVYSAHFMPEELVQQQLAAQHCATAAARGWAALGPGPPPPGPPGPPGHSAQQHQQQHPGAMGAAVGGAVRASGGGSATGGAMARPGTATGLAVGAGPVGERSLGMGGLGAVAADDNQRGGGAYGSSVAQSVKRNHR